MDWGSLDVLLIDTPPGEQLPTVIHSVADPDLGSGAFLTPGSGMNIPDHFSESLQTILGLKVLQFFDVDPDPG